jgi:hypothetical protein
MRNIFFLLFFLCVLSSTASADCDAGYLSNTKCTSGNCTDGYGTREAEYGTYIGEFKNCKYHGWGTLRGKRYYFVDTWMDKEDKIGEWKNGFLDGYGIIYRPTGYTSAIYEEHLAVERIERDESICISGNCANGYGTKIDLGLEYKYVGEFKKRLFDGQGTLIFRNGKRYVGEFKQLLFSGQGILTYPDGSTYSGEWKKNQRHGLGTYVFADGTTAIAIWDKHDPVKLLGNENSSTNSDGNNNYSSTNSTSVSEWLSIAQQGFDMMSGTSSTGSSASQTCFKTGEVKQAFNKICNYKCGLTTYTHNLGSGVGLCPSTIQR